MKRLILTFMVLMLFVSMAYASDEIMLASISSKENLLGINSSMGASGAGAATYHLLTPGADVLLGPDANNIDVFP